MSPATKKEAQAKLATFAPKIGYPKRWLDYRALEIRQGDLLGNVRRAREFAWARDLAKLGKPVDRDEWFMTPQSVNAYYNASLNEIVFPASVLQPPFFDPAADDAHNYGAIGAIIGHEISHGFDDEGSQFDGTGNLRVWWTDEDRKRFEAKTRLLVAQYSAFSPFAGYHVNGELTLGENIADNSGLEIAFKAYRRSLGGKPAPVIDGTTGDERFFYGFAQAFRGKARDAVLLTQIKSDPHSPDEFRVNGTVRNHPRSTRRSASSRATRCTCRPSSGSRSGSGRGTAPSSTPPAPGVDAASGLDPTRPPSPMNLDLDLLPERCDALVVGAGPAGSAAAQLLARAGRDVVLVDQQAFPRDKVCGDGLIPDAHRALDRLGVLGEVMAEARSSATLACIAPRGGRIDVPGRLAVLPRQRLDEILCRAAVDAGARMFAPVRFVSPLRDGAGRVVGARLQQRRSRRARCAHAGSCSPPARSRRRRSPPACASGARRAASPCAATSRTRRWRRASPSLEVRLAQAPLARLRLDLSLRRRRLQHRRRRRPEPPRRQGRQARDAGRQPARGLRRLQVALRAGARARRRRRWHGDPGHELKGAPLRCSLEGARLEAPGVLVTGEAAGSTYAFTGEGIGKAMETAMHAAEAILAHAATDTSDAADAAIRADYAARVLSLKPRFDLYEEANRVNAHPWLVDLLVWSAKRSPRRVQRMAGVLEETHIPTDAVTVRGVLRRLVDWR